MIVNYEKVFVFVHIPKCAGKSIRQSLMSISGSLDKPKGKSKHLTADEILELLPDVSQFSFFAFVRNPWDRLLSMHRYLLKTGIRPDLPIPAEFSDLVDMLAAGEPWLKTLHSIRAQNEFVRDEFTFIGRYENLDKDFLRLCRLLDVQLTLSHQNASVEHRVDYRPFYSDRAAEIVDNIYRQDIIRFGYAF